MITSSIAGLSGARTRFSAKSHGMPGYIAAKHGVVGLMRYYASLLAEKNIRVNTVHPTGVATPMAVNDQVEQLFADQPEYAAALENLLPVPFIEPIDISDAMIYLCGHSGRYITGATLPVDAGYWSSKRSLGRGTTYLTGGVGQLPIGSPADAGVQSFQQVVTPNG